MVSVLLVVPARELNLFYTELGTEPNLETLTLIIKPHNALLLVLSKLKD